jgi:hypothetical protein
MVVGDHASRIVGARFLGVLPATLLVPMTIWAPNTPRRVNGRRRLHRDLLAVSLGTTQAARPNFRRSHLSRRPSSAAAADARIEAVQVNPDGARLAELVRLVDEGVLTLRVAETYALEDAAKAHARLAKGGLRGRLVIVPDHG